MTSPAHPELDAIYDIPSQSDGRLPAGTEGKSQVAACGSLRLLASDDLEINVNADVTRQLGSRATDADLRGQGQATTYTLEPPVST
jgi:hypothetical protein